MSTLVVLGRISEQTRGPIRSATDVDGKSVWDGVTFCRTSNTPGPKSP